MFFCSKCGRELSQGTVVCPYCGATNKKGLPKNPNDRISAVICIFAALFPIFGIIYSIVKHKKTPRRAAAALISAIAAWLITVIFYFVTVL